MQYLLQYERTKQFLNAVLDAKKLSQKKIKFIMIIHFNLFSNNFPSIIIHCLKSRMP